MLHRANGPAVVRSNGTKAWWVNGLRHREDGPAGLYADGSVQWYKHGELHREDGPAVEYPNDLKKWYLDGVELSEEEHLQRTKGDGLLLVTSVVDFIKSIFLPKWRLE